MSNLDQDLKRVEDDIDKVTSKINDLDHDDVKEKTKLSKAQSDVSHARSEVEKAQRKLQEADAEVHAINAEQSKIATERARVANDLTQLNSKKQSIVTNIQREAEKNHVK